MHLPHQRGPLHNLPDTPEAYDAVLADVVEQALRRMTPEGNLEHPTASTTSATPPSASPLLVLAQQRTKDPRLPEAVRRSLAFHLNERVYTEDNPGYGRRSPSNASTGRRTCWPGCRTPRTTATGCCERPTRPWRRRGRCG
ncbi:hypothetical protein [Streptomyces himalayensis]|uniref:hypothetical protein n=1 Tax=Streptomyces himalayensis TaxID=2820085 RepID=UPI0035E45468